ncbi:MAG: hypothetical protein ACFCU9_06650 [Cyanophyceae cyanobacterium]
MFKYLVPICLVWSLSLVGCGTLSTRPAEQVVRDLVSAANRKDYATAESLLTPRLLSRIAPGILDQLWVPGEEVNLYVVSQKNDTATIDVDLALEPHLLATRIGIPGSTLLEWSQNPPLGDRTFRDSAELMALYAPYGDRVLTRLRMTLYKRESGWQIEHYRPQVINEAALAPPPFTGPEEPFTLTGTVRSVNPEWIGINIQSGSDNMRPYQRGWVAIIVTEDAEVTDTNEEEVNWQNLSQGSTLEMSGIIKFAAEPDPTGRTPASIRASTISVIAE